MLIVKKFIIRELECSHKFVDDTKYQYNLIASLINGDEIILTHLFSDEMATQEYVEGILLKVIKSNIQWETINID